MSPAEIAQESHNFLAQVLREAYEVTSGTEDLRSAFIYRHSKNIGDIANEVFFLYNNNLFTVGSIAVRSMLESFFCVAAAFHNKDFAAEKIIAECEDFFSRLERIEKNHGIAGLMEAGINYQKTAARLRKEHNIVSRNKWTIYDVALAGKQEGFYVTEYFLHCRYVHSTTSGLISQERWANVGMSVHCAIFTVIVTAATVAQAIQTKTPQAHVDKASKLLGILSQMEANKVFDNLNKRG